MTQQEIQSPQSYGKKKKKILPPSLMLEDKVKKPTDTSYFFPQRQQKVKTEKQLRNGTITHFLTRIGADRSRTQEPASTERKKKEKSSGVTKETGPRRSKGNQIRLWLLSVEQ